MRAGWLRHRITFQRQGDTQDSFGDVTGAWEDVVTLWGSIEPLRGREYVEASQNMVDVTTRIRLRFNRDITTLMRGVWCDETGQEHMFDILSVTHPLEKRRETHLMCREVIT